MLQLAGAYQELKSLDVHEQLTLVIVGSATPDGIVVDYRLKGVGLPFLQRFGRLHIVVSVHQNGLV